jgi:hypothetical protein
VLASILILVLAVLIIAGSCATEKMAYVSKEYEFYGTWVNPDYKFADKASPKFIIHPNGKLEWYAIGTEKTTTYYGEFVIINKWTDSKGNIWYSITWKGDYEKFWTYVLAKISNSGKTLEYVDSPNDYPKEIDPNDPRAYYRI